MDIHMPVMDGLEASKLIMELNIGVPIVAMTANVMAHDRELYKKIGMRDCLGKPFRVQDLYAYLAKYLKPGTWSGEAAENKQFDDKLKTSLIASFVKDNKNRFSEITNALSSGDIKLAHRLAHTLKSNAALLGRDKLQKAAAQAERQLEDGKNQITQELLDVLETELAAALNELEPLVKEASKPAPPAQTLSAEEARAVLAELKPLLERGSPDCLKFIEKLRGIPGTEELIQQMEDLDFEEATETLEKVTVTF
jgi:CheY-like chemotaxis protein